MRFITASSSSRSFRPLRRRASSLFRQRRCRRRASPDQLTLPFIDGTAANAKSLVDKLVALSPAAEAIGTALKSYIDNLAAIALFLLGKRVAHQERDAARKRTAYKKQQNDSLGDFFSEEKTSAEKTSAEKTRSDSDSDSLSYLLDDDDDDARARANGKNEGKIEPVVPYGDIAKRLAGDCEQIVRAAGKYPRIAWPESATGRAIEHFLKAGLRADVIVDGVRIGTDRAPGVIRTFDYFCVPGGTIEEVQARASAKPELSLGVMGMTGRGSTPPTPVAAGVIIRRGTPQVDAWEKHNGKPFLWGIRSVATVPTEWPPGYEPHRKEADRAKGAA